VLEYVTAGESHGPELVAVLTGLPAGVPVDRTFLQAMLRRRKNAEIRTAKAFQLFLISNRRGAGPLGSRIFC
jgi:chorismate synthase